MMISRRNFAMLTAIMLVVLFMFQATGIAKNRLNHAQTNEYALENRTDMQSENAFSPDVETDRRVLLVADEKTSGVAATVREWCTYSKRGLVMVENVEDCAPYLNSAEVLLVDSTALDFDRDVVVLQGYVDQGVSVIFCNLPDVTVVGNHVELEELLGIRGIYNPQVKLTGIQLFDGFLLGGMQIYKAEKPEEQELQDMDLTVPWYLTVNGNTAYMVGLVDDLKSQDGEVENEYAPGLIWRYSGRSGSVFVVNGDFLEDVTGIGILEAMMYELHDYELYPIVNAQNLSVANYPSFANENSQEIQKRYSRELPSLYRDVIWQSISSVTERNRSKTTALLAPQYDYTDENEPLADTFTYYARLFREKGMEIGLSFEQISELPLEEKIARDLSFLNENLAGYEYRAVYVSQFDETSRKLLASQPGLSTVTTVATDYDSDQPLLSYEDDLLIQRGTNDAFSHTYTENLRMRSIESALGYTAVIMNMERVAYPQTEEDSWEKLYEKMSANLMTYWKPYDYFDKTTLSESDVRIRRFLNLDYSESRRGEQLSVEITNFEHEAFFILRTHGEQVKDVENGTFLKMENDAYLIGADAENIVITLEKEDDKEYYYYR